MLTGTGLTPVREAQQVMAISPRDADRQALTSRRTICLGYHAPARPVSPGLKERTVVYECACFGESRSILCQHPESAKLDRRPVPRADGCGNIRRVAGP